MTIWDPGPPIVRTKWQKVKYWLWYNLYYKWHSKYRWWVVKRMILKGKLLPNIIQPYKGFLIDDVVIANQMTHIKDTKLNWVWIKKEKP